MNAMTPALGKPALLPLVFTALYALSILAANLTLDRFIQLPVFGLLSVGTLFFGAVFTLRDRIHQTGGLRYVYTAIALALIVNTVAAIYLETPIRFIIASFLSILVAELTDTAIYHRFMHEGWWSRVLKSNAVSVPLDSILFSLLAFYGDMSARDIAQIIFADVIVKYLIAAVIAIRLRNVSDKSMGVS